MMRKWLEFGLTGDQEDRYRQSHLAADLAQARIGIWLIVVPFVLFLFNDYQFFGLSGWFYGLTASRLGLLVYTLLLLGFMRRVKDYRSYDRAEFVWGLIVVSFALVVNITRPQFIGHVVIIIVAVFITLLIIPNKFINQILLSLAFVIGEALIVAPNLRASAVQTSFSILLSLFLATAIGISSSRQLHSWRRREFLSREEEQKLLAERKEADEKLRRNREWLRVTLISIGDAVISADTLGRITFLNPAAQALTGWPHEEAVGEPIETVFRIINEKTLEPVEDIVRRVLQEGSAVTLSDNTALITRTGQSIPIEDSAAPIIDREGNISGVVLVFCDVSQKRQDQEAIRESHARLSSALESITDAYFAYDDEWHFIDVNPEAEKVLGSKASRLIGQRIFDLYPQTEQSEPFRHYRKAVEERKPVHFEARSPISGDWYEFHAYPRPGRLEVYLKNINDRKLAEEALRSARDELEIRVKERTAELAKANETLRELSSRLLSTQEEERKRVACEIHDTLGSCLSAVKFKVENALQMIEMTPGASLESLKAVIPVIQETMEECRRIQYDLRPSILDDLGLLATFSWFCRRFQDIYSHIRIDQEVGIKENEIPEALKIVIYRITQEAMNNIAKHSKADRVRLSLRRNDDRIEFVLRDNGLGFEPEKKSSPGRTERGLGLKSMTERVELSGGEFDIESIKGKGTTIRAWWPI